MTRARRFAAGAAVVALVALLGAAVGPGVLADPSVDGPTRPGPVDIAEEPAIEPGEVGDATAELRLHTRIAHRGNPTPNVSVRVRAFDAESGLLVAEETVALGELTGDRSVPVNASVVVAREGGYVLETTLFADGRAVDRTRTRVSGLAALGTEARFTDSEAVPALAVSVASVDEARNRTTLRVAASVTNHGVDETDTLRVEVLLRQADSNLVAARADARTDGIGPGKTTEVATTLTVPSGYNYYVDAALYRDGVLVDTARSVANLDPTETVSANETIRDVEFEVGDFAGDGGATPTREPRATEMAVTETGAPGFTVALALAALAAGTAALLARRRSR